MTFLGTRFYILLNTDLITMHCRMLGSVFDIGTFFLLQMLIHHCVSFLRSRPLPPMANLNAIGRTIIYLRRSGMLLGHKIRITSTWPIKAL
jgi:hypothetical protein